MFHQPHRRPWVSTFSVKTSWWDRYRYPRAVGPVGVRRHEARVEAMWQSGPADGRQLRWMRRHGIAL
jgi:hypothetical protein